MIKKILFILCLTLSFSLCVVAENTENPAAVEETAPTFDGRPGTGGMRRPRGEMGERPQMGEPPAMPAGERPGVVEREASVTTEGETTAQNDTSEAEQQPAGWQGDRPFGDNGGQGRMPGGMPGQMNGEAMQESTAGQTDTSFLGFVKTYSTPITAMVLLALAFVFVICYKRKRY